VPESRSARYRGLIGKDVLFGLRPEHITETRGHNGGGHGHDFTITLDVVEPMGMETMVFFKINGSEVCGRVEPSAARGAGENMTLRANLDHMHLIDPATNLVV
jgi:multiple sugar transport system ATP-binding protein